MSIEIFHSHEIASFKRKFNNQLEPIKVMLIHRKIGLTREEWVNFVSVTRQSIIDHPDQYLDCDLPDKSTFEFLVEKIFEEFVNREKRW